VKSARKSRTDTVEHGGISATFLTSQLPFCDATDLLADISAAVAPTGGMYLGGYADRGEALGKLAKDFIGGRLSALLQRLLAGTTMTVRGVGNVDLIDSRDKLDLAFTGREAFVFPAVRFALEVNFKGFLDGIGLIGLKIPKLSPSEDSSPSTSTTG
jgi:hypothetical protein